jgi:ABC-type phosphate transport system permease subunit
LELLFFTYCLPVYLSEIAKKRTRNLLRPLIELLAGIPSVVYGFFGLVVIVPLIQSLLVYLLVKLL